MKAFFKVIFKICLWLIGIFFLIMSVFAMDLFLNPSNAEKLKEIREEIREEKIVQEKLDREIEKKKQREIERLKTKPKKKTKNEIIQSHLNGWSGGHYKLTRIIKKQLNDPKSYKHVETRYFAYDDHYIVAQTFRAKNSFGGYVRNTVKAKIDYNGDVLDVFE